MVLVLLAAAPAAGQPEERPPCSVRQARAQFELGQAHLKLEKYEQAMADFEAGYACIPMPVFLYDIAQMARFSGERAKALEFYRRYLAAEPHAREHVAVERWIAALSKPHGQPATPRPSAAAPVVIGPTSAPPPRPPEPTPPLPVPPPAMPAAPPAALTATIVHRPPEKPSHRGRWIALGVIGGVLVVGGAVTAGVLLGRPRDDGIPNGFHDLGAVDAAPH
jgi:tetratricopeptide (TPR) repeat protein